MRKSVDINNCQIFFNVTYMSTIETFNVCHTNPHFTLLETTSAFHGPLEMQGGIPYVYPVEREHVIWHEESHGELHHQACCAVLPDREDGFVRVGGETRQVLPFLLRQHHGQHQHTWGEVGGAGGRSCRGG